MKTTLLVVDDEEKMLEFIVPYFRSEGYRVLTATTGKSALRVAQDEKPMLVILDWMLPEMSGLDVCRELRVLGPVGIIMLTARTDEADKIVGLEFGADDYMTKPFSLRELAARVRSVIRRLEGHQEQIVLQRGPLTISDSHCRVWKSGEEIPLTRTEFKMLLTLAAKPGIVFSRLQLLKAAMEDDYLNYERTVDTHIRNLRKKIEDDPSSPIFVETVYGFGYRFGGMA